MQEKRKFGFRDQLGYFFGDYANSLFFMLTASYLTLFYVDILGISALSVGILLVCVRIWDAINDPLIGAWIDRRPFNPKKGKFRPWLLYMSIPVIVFGVLSFVAIPSLVAAPIHVKLIYAYVTYIGFGMSYTAINISYGSLASTITDVETERSTLSMFRSYGSVGGSLTVSVLLPMLVFNEQHKPTAGGFMKLVSFMAVMALVSYFLCYQLTTERIIAAQKEGETRKMSDTLKGFAQNRPLLVQMVTAILSLCMFLIQGTLAPYLFKDAFQNITALTFNGFLAIGAMLVLSPFLKPLIVRYGKKQVSVFSTMFYSVMWICYLLMPNKNIVVYFIFAGLAQLGITAFNLIIWAFIPDCVDYQEYRTGVREEGTIYAVYSFSRKLGQALAGFLGAYALIWIGYSVNQPVQSPETLEKIKTFVAVIPAVAGIAISLIMHYGYNLDKETLEHVTRELRKKRESQ